MSDLSSTDTVQPDAHRSSVPGGPAVRIILWVLLLIFAALNITANAIDGWNLLIGLPSGLVVIGCAAGLVIHHRKQRPSRPE